METAANSAGSALKENAVWLDSIEGKTTTLTNSLQNMWNNALTADGVKFFLDMANGVVRVIDKVGLLQTALAGILGLVAASKNNNFGNFFMFDNKLKTEGGKVSWDGGLFAGIKEAFSQIQPSNKEGLTGLFFSKDGREQLKNYIKEVKNYDTTVQAAANAERTAAVSGGILNKVRRLGTAITHANSAANIKNRATVTAVGVASTVASVGVQVLNAALTMGISLLATGLITGVMKMIDSVVHRAENLKQEVQELTEAYNEAKKTYSDNLDKLTTPSDTSVYSTLSEEFRALAQHVSENGDNMSLTAAQYERYKEICDIICEVNPNLAAGYDTTTEAIGNNVAALENLIEAQKEAAAKEAREYTSTDNMSKYAEEAVDDYKEAAKDLNSAEANLKATFREQIAAILFESDSADITTSTNGQKIVEKFLEASGMSPEAIKEVIKEYTYAGTNGEFGFETWMSENLDYISEHVNGFSSELEAAAAAYRDASSDIKAAQEGIINELLEVPVSIDKYADLGSSEKSFITEWIKHSDMFKVDEDFNAEDILDMKETINDVVNNIIQGDYTTKLDSGNKIDASTILDSIFNFDATSVDWEKYQTQINEYVDLLWDAIGGKKNDLGFEDKDALKLSLGIDFQIEEESKMIQQYVKLKGVSEENAQKYFDSLPAAEVQRLLQIDWDNVDNSKIDQILEPQVSIADPVNAYSTLVSNVEAYTAALSESHDVVVDNTVVTQDFYDSLVDLAGSQEAVAEYFDAANPLMVKNAEGLNELLQESRNNVEANIDLAESQTRFKYYELVQDLEGYGNKMEEACIAGKNLTNTQIENANSTMDQIDSVQQAIYKYQLLKETLSETGKAYQNFQEAQAIDELNTTGDNYVEMAQTVYDAFYDNGQVGTQAFDAAVQALIPDEVYASLESDGDKLQAIYKYFNNKILPSLTLDKEAKTLSFDQDDIEDFVDKGINKGIFSGSATDGLAAKIGMSYEEAAEKVGMTVNQFKAYLAELEKYDYNTSAESFLSQFDQSFDGQVSHVTSKMQELNEEKIALLQDGGYEENKERITEINNELNKCDSSLKKMQPDAVELYEKFAKNQHAIESLETVEDKTQKISDIMDKDQAMELGINWDKSKDLTVQEALDKLMEKKLGLEEPTELMVQFAQQGVMNEIDSLIAQIEKEKKINLGVEYNDDTGEYEIDENSKYVSKNPTTGEITVTGLGELGASLETNLNTFDSLNSWLDTGLVTTETLLADIKATLNSLYEKTTGEKAPNDKPEKKSDKSENNPLGMKDKPLIDLLKNNEPIKMEDKPLVDSFGGEKAKKEIEGTREELEKLNKERDKLSKKTEGTDLASPERKAVANKQKEIEASATKMYQRAFKEVDLGTDTNKKLAIEAAVKYEKTGDLDDLKADLATVGDEKNQAEVVVTLAKEGAFNELLTDLNQGERELVIKAITEGTDDVDKLNQILDGIEDEEVRAEVGVLIDKALTNIDYVDGKLEQTDNTTVTAEADVQDNASEKIAGLQSDLGILNSTTANPNVLLRDNATPGILGVQTELATTDGMSADPSVDVSVTGLGLLQKAKKLIDKIKGVVGVNGTAHVKGTAWVGGTAHKGGSWGAPRTEAALVGELGPEMIVRGNRWFTVGDNGAEFANIQKGDIIFNHKQTEQLLSNGYITSRGKLQGGAHAQGTAYALWSVSSSGGNSEVTKTGKNKIKAKKTKEYSEDFEEIFDWFEIKIEEINEDLDLMAARLENAITLQGKNNILESMIKTNKNQLVTLQKGYKLYSTYANNVLKKIPKAYRDEAKNGKIAIEEFRGKVDEQALEAIKNYREWAQKAADVRQQIAEIRREITELAKQKIDNIIESFDNRTGVESNEAGHFVDMAEYQEERGEIVSEEYYEAAIREEQERRELLIKERQKLQDALDAEVAAGTIDVGSPEWYEAVNEIHAVDSEIDASTSTIEGYQNKINEIHFDNFEKGLYRVSRLADETKNLIDLMSDADAVTTDEFGNVNWTDEGITQLGLNAQNMENYKQQIEMYGEEIDHLNMMYARGEISEQEYLEKLEELQQGQYDAIQGYNDSRDAIVELQRTRVDAIKEGIEKEIDAYSELIDKKKEELSAEKDLYDFRESVMEQQKSVADLERQLAALAGDNSASARAQRKKLEAERAKAQKELDNTYYDRSVEKQQETLDAELEVFTKTQEKIMEGLDKWLENVDAVVEDAVETVETSGDTIQDTIEEVAKEWNLQIDQNITKPWNDASTALETTATVLDGIVKKFESAVDAADDLAESQIAEQEEENDTISDGKQKPVKGLTVTATQGTQIYDANGNVIRTVEDKHGETYTAGKTDETTGRTQIIGSDGQVVGWVNSASLEVDKTFKKGQQINASNQLIYDSPTDTTGEVQDKTTYVVTKVDNQHKRVQVALPDKPNKPVGWFNMADVAITRQAPTNASGSTGSGGGNGAGSGGGNGSGSGGGNGSGGVRYYTRYTGRSNSIVDALNAIGVNSSYNNRKKIAGANDIKNYSGTAQQNTKMLNLLKQGKLKKYAKGSLGVLSDQLALIDELGEELQLVPGNNGRLEYVKKGTGIIPADLTSNLMKWGELDPQDILDRNKPVVGVSPEVHATEVNLNIQYGDMLRIDNFKGDNPDEIAKIVAQQFEKHTKELNNSLRKYVR